MGTTTVEQQEQQQYLPEELFFEIFSQYLPVKSLLVCKSVCKSWLLLINSPQFVETHLLRSSAKAIEESSQLAIYRKRSSLRSLFIYKSSSSSNVVNGGPSLRERPSSVIDLQIPYPSYKDSYHLYYLQSCRGLVCMTISVCYLRFFGLVANPATRECYQLPKLPGKSLESCWEPRILYDESSGSYKVVRLSFSCRNFDLSAYVITLGKDATWRKLVVNVSFECCHYVFPSLHGIPSPLGSSKETVRLLVFVPENENFFTIDFQHDGLSNLKSCSAAFRGSLYLLDYSDARNLDVWVMKDYKDKIWVKEEKSFNLKSIIFPTINEAVYDEVFVVGYIYIAPRAVIDEGIVMMLNIPSWHNNEEVCDKVIIYLIYDPMKKVLQRFNVSDELKDLGDSEWAEFTESLVSPKRGY